MEDGSRNVPLEEWTNTVSLWITQTFLEHASLSCYCITTHDKTATHTQVTSHAYHTHIITAVYDNITLMSVCTGGSDNK